jgi:hypothetical protein
MRAEEVGREPLRGPLAREPLRGSDWDGGHKRLRVDQEHRRRRRRLGQDLGDDVRGYLPRRCLDVREVGVSGPGGGA